VETPAQFLSRDVCRRPDRTSTTAERSVGIFIIARVVFVLLTNVFLARVIVFASGIFAVVSVERFVAFAKIVAFAKLVAFPGFRAFLQTRGGFLARTFSRSPVALPRRVERRARGRGRVRCPLARAFLGLPPVARGIRL